MKNKIIIFVLLIVLVVTFFVILNGKKAAAPTNENPQSKITYVNASKDLIVVDLPYPDAVTGKEFAVVGKARGTWYFEASFPVKVLDRDGKQLWMGPAQAQSEWMTEEFVPFRVDIKVPESYIGPATLVLEKDNPSGEPARDASVSFPFTIEY